MNKFLKWWKVWGQVWGFLLHVSVVSILMIGFNDWVTNSTIGGILWLVSFFGGAWWYSWQMKIHGWKLPDNIRNTH